MTATTAKGRIQKGKDLENWVVEQLKSKGLDPRAKRSYGSGNGDGCKADIDTSLTILGQAAGFECKHRSNLNVTESWKQAVKLQSLNYEPILVLKHTHDQYANTKAVIYLDTLLELVKNQK
jgi:hypothetical protein